MAVGPVTLNGMIQRTQDVGMLKQQEETKPHLDQQNIQTNIRHQENRLLKQVKHANDAEQHEEKYDAREKGKNSYEGGQEKKKQQSDDKENGKVILKQESGHFDMKV